MLKLLAEHRRPVLIALRVVLFVGTAIGLYWALKPVPPASSVHFRDKVEHFICFYLLTATALAAYPKARAVILVLVLAVFGAAIEGLQALPVIGRDAEFLDWVADIAGVLTALLPALALPPVRRALEP